MKYVRYIRISEVEEEAGEFEVLRLNTIKLGAKENDDRVKNINVAINGLKLKISNIRKQIEETRSFISKAKWFEYGERPNKFFLNLNKARQKQNLINSIKNGEELYDGQERVMEGISKFYSDLYSLRTDKGDREHDNFYENCPKLNETQRNLMDREISLDELSSALQSCKDSAPGPDGIPYSIYKRYWPLMGPIILKSWEYSLANEIMPPSHSESVITLLPKEGKDC
jgi:hypothetical protein